MQDVLVLCYLVVLKTIFNLDAQLEFQLELLQETVGVHQLIPPP